MINGTLFAFLLLICFLADDIHSRPLDMEKLCYGPVASFHRLPLIFICYPARGAISERRAGYKRTTSRRRGEPSAGAPGGLPEGLARRSPLYSTDCPRRITIVFVHGGRDVKFREVHGSQNDARLSYPRHKGRQGNINS